MKKFYLILAALAALTLTAQAQEVKSGVLEVGDYSNASTFYNGSYFDMAPTNFYLDHYASQMLYLAEQDFADFADKENVKITKISYKFFDQAIYDDITALLFLGLTEVDESAFLVDDSGNKLYFYPDLHIGYLYEYEAFSANGEDNELSLDLAFEPFEVTPGKNLLVTVVCDLQSGCTTSSDDAPFYTSNLRNRVLTYSDNNDSFIDYMNTASFPKCSLTYSGGSTNSNLPVTKIEYTYTDSSTAISEVSAAAETEGAYYNLMGQKVNPENQHGIFIHNGKKLVK